jgi:hypothetical protein
METERCDSRVHLHPSDPPPDLPVKVGDIVAIKGWLGVLRHETVNHIYALNPGPRWFFSTEEDGGIHHFPVEWAQVAYRRPVVTP